MRLYLLPLVYLLLLPFAMAAQGYRSSLDDFYLAEGIDGGKFFKRLSIAVGKQYIPGEIKFQFNGFVDTVFRDIKQEDNLKSKESYAVHVGSYFPITLVSDNSMLVLNIELYASVTKLSYDSIAVTARKNIMIPYETYRAGMPVSIEYRIGGDVLLNKSSKTIIGIGGGLCPQIIKSDDYNKQIPILITPFIKGELGFFAGLAFKVRAMYYWGTYHYGITEEYGLFDTPNNYTKAEFNGASGFSISLVAMPFSFLWNKN